VDDVMKVVVLHSEDAAGPPRDPVLDQLGDALGKAGHECSFIGTYTDVVHIIRSLRDAAPDLIFNLSESFDDKSALDASLTALLNLLDLRYTGSSPSGLMVAGDKSLAKKILRFHDIKTPEFATLYRGSVDWADDLSFPLIVKPPQEDASIGITTASVVHDLKELFTKIDELQSEYRSPILAEEFIDGREFYIGVLGNAHAEALPVIELDFSAFPAGKPRVASWDAKWGAEAEGGAGKGKEFEGTKSVFPDTLDADLVERMQKVAVNAFDAFRLRDYARVDLRVRDDGEIYVIEVNPNCYLEKEAEFARAAAKHGLDYDALIARIMELASGRYAR
jgi:D-alanine-D-alanine ligase